MHRSIGRGTKATGHRHRVGSRPLVTLQHLVYRPEIGTLDARISHPDCRITIYFHGFNQGRFLSALFRFLFYEISKVINVLEHVVLQQIYQSTTAAGQGCVQILQVRYIALFQKQIKGLRHG